MFFSFLILFPSFFFDFHLSANKWILLKCNVKDNSFSDYLTISGEKLVYYYSASLGNISKAKVEIVLAKYSLGIILSFEMA